MQRRRVYLAYTGGTIGMRRTEDGYRPEPGYLDSLLASLRELQDDAMPSLELGEYTPLLDSSNMRPSDWWRIGDDILRRRDDFDGFVIIHGTDTMAYTASALSFLLAGLGKTVIVTGSQVPLCEVRGDARDNLITSILLAAGPRIPEVCLYFGGKLLRGNRAQKVNADGFDAFDSPDFPALGTVGVDIVIQWDRVRPFQGGGLGLHHRAEPFVGEMRIFPGISSRIVQNFLAPPLQGLVMETYGVGNAPDRDPELLRVIGEACERGVVVVGVTQCARGTVDMDDYATGRHLKEVGVISGYDLTPEAALTKLYLLLSQGLPPEEVRKLMQQDLCGELTLPGVR